VANDAQLFSAVANGLCGHFGKWNKCGVWGTCLDRLVAYRREQMGRTAKPSDGILDAQSVKTVFARPQENKRWLGGAAETLGG
jgi:hypothetical protein